MNKIDLFRGEYNFLSNFAFAKVELDGVIYRSVEHAYQAAKSEDPIYRSKIQAINLPSRAKHLGRFGATLRADWDKIKIDVMLDLVRKKFSIPEFRSKLLATGDAELIEGNNWNDTFWGCCGGHGENYLGKILMKTRAELKS